MNDFIELCDDLKGHMDSIYNKFLKKHVQNPLASPEIYKEDVQAYCILAHAYLEEYVEEISAQVRDKSIDLWLSQDKRITLPLLTLLSYSNQKFDLLAEKEKIPYKSIYMRLKDVFDSVKTQHSADIYQNHGASEQYLRKILGPVAIDVSQDPRLMNSLSVLAKARGSYAHKNAKKTLAPEDAKICVEDCLDLCEDIEKKAYILFRTKEEYENLKKFPVIKRLTLLLRNLYI